MFLFSFFFFFVKCFCFSDFKGDQFISPLNQTNPSISWWKCLNYCLVWTNRPFPVSLNMVKVFGSTHVSCGKLSSGGGWGGWQTKAEETDESFFLCNYSNLFSHRCALTRQATNVMLIERVVQKNDNYLLCWTSLLPANQPEHFKDSALCEHLSPCETKGTKSWPLLHERVIIKSCNTKWRLIVDMATLSMAFWLTLCLWWVTRVIKWKDLYSLFFIWIFEGFFLDLTLNDKCYLLR